MNVARSAWTLLALSACWACGFASDDRTGAVCAADHECADLSCVALLEPAPRDLAVLTLQCAPLGAGNRPGTACEQARDCDRGLCLLAGACAQSCSEAADCPEGQHCQAIYARSAADQLARALACVDDVNLPDGTRKERSLTAVHGAIDDLDLPPSAADTLYVLEHLSDDSWPVPSRTSRCRPPLCAQRLRTSDAEARVLFDLDQLADAPDGPDNPIAQGSHVNPLTVWIPNGPRLSPEVRGYTLTVESKIAGAVRVTVLSRPERGARLDLNLYYVGAEGLAPEGERGVAVLHDALDEVERIFEPAGIYLGEVRQIRVPGALPARGSQLPSAEVSAGFQTLISQYQVLPELPELFRLSAGAANRALDVFFVADIEAGGADVHGISGGTPVAFGMHGTPGSGVVLASDDLVQRGDSQTLGRSLAHELGHALGLFHTTEVDGLVVEGLPDTPACPLSQDRDHSGTLDAVECAVYGGDNLMFPTSDAGLTLTVQQCAVLQAALILQ
jgi:hypothetical protein